MACGRLRNNRMAPRRIYVEPAGEFALVIHAAGNQGRREETKFVKLAITSVCDKALVSVAAGAAQTDCAPIASAQHQIAKRQTFPAIVNCAG